MAVITANTVPDIRQPGMPVTIITGFLGSGKTTLLNQILQNRQNLKVAVLVNKFGDINIDSQLLVSLDEDMVELSNGCICCTINDGLVDAIYRVLEREDRIDYLVIETTGVADPLPVALTFLGTEQMPENVFRAKGILWFSDSNLRHIFQLSGKRYSMDTLEWQKSPSTQLVLIGRQLDVTQIREQLNNCLVS
jgi:G3E family GTPase